MCEECYQFPCHPRCPNAPEPVAVHECVCCGSDIYAGEDYYDIEGDAYCKECVTSKTAEMEDYDE